MSKRTFFILASAVAVLAVLFIAADSDALRLKKDSQTKKTGDFSLTGKFNGTVAGEISVNKQKVWVTKDTAVYNASKGAARAGLVVTNRDVFVTGKWKDGVRVATMVYVRAPGDRVSKDNDGAKYRVPSSSNADVGELTDDVGR